jgi:flavin reductase (DIM6/NTAB) family NADH-FMN oxidoreductase RutF
MKLVKKILGKLNGLHFGQEYLCLARESFLQPLHAYLVDEDHILKDITNEHLFVGYCPLVFAIAGIPLTENINMIFSQQLLQPNERFAKKDAIADLELRKIKQQPAGEDHISYYEGTNGKHHFQPGFHQLISSINNRLYNKKPGNVFLHNNLYKQVQLAYAIPRTISLITVGDGHVFNLFPTDLHGQAGAAHYIISLRTGGKAAAQVKAAGKLVISNLHCDAYKTVYALGKNHMQELKTKDNFPFDDLSSANLQLPLPKAIFSYRELKLEDSFTYGIHTIFLFSILNQQQIKPATATLAHIHNSYASWRYKNKLPGNYLLR